MVRYVVFGSLVFLIVVLVLAPARLVGLAVAQNPGVRLLETRGTVWRGSAVLLLNSVDQGRLQWTVDPLMLLTLSLSADWLLQHPFGVLNGTAKAGFSTTEVSADGTLAADAFNNTLSTYDLFVDGELTFRQTSIKIAQSDRTITNLDGQMEWSGGLVRFILGGKLTEATLPPLVANMRMDDSVTPQKPQAVVFDRNQQTPLIIAQMGENGFVKIGITKLFTKMLNRPWPGSDLDHVVVLEVEEQIL